MSDFDDLKQLIEENRDSAIPSWTWPIGLSLAVLILGFVIGSHTLMLISIGMSIGCGITIILLDFGPQLKPKSNWYNPPPDEK